MRKRIVAAVPVKDEAERIGACLAALTAQTSPADDILLLLNNCADGTLEICQRLQADHRHIHIIHCHLAGALASAGEARRLALEYAAHLAGDGVLLTTDADSVPPLDWIEANMMEIIKGADAVCGMAMLDPAEAAALPPRLHLDHAREAGCLGLIDEIDALVDPDPIDPWPRHQQHSGASIAVTAPAFRKAGGAPHIAAGEDRALVHNLALTDARIRHAPGIVVRVSARLQGRAAGGMAETIQRRIIKPDELTDERLEPATDAYRRSLAKAAARAAWHGEYFSKTLAENLLISPARLRQALAAPYFGAAWEDIQRASPVLHRRRVAVQDLDRETRQAALLRDQLLSEIARVIPQSVTGGSVAA